MTVPMRSWKQGYLVSFYDYFEDGFRLFLSDLVIEGRMKNEKEILAKAIKVAEHERHAKEIVIEFYPENEVNSTFEHSYRKKDHKWKLTQ